MALLKTNKRLLLLTTTVALGAASLSVWATATRVQQPDVMAAPKPQLLQITINPRRQLLKHFPCSRCHQAQHGLAENLAEHPQSHPSVGHGPHSAMRFVHPKSLNACSLCHDYSDFDSLRLLTGKTIDFNESHLLCAQCHAEKGRDFTIGAHGKLVGSWQTHAVRYTCTDCHAAHAPKLEPVLARPAPPFPKFGIRKGGEL